MPENQPSMDLAPVAPQPPKDIPVAPLAVALPKAIRTADVFKGASSAPFTAEQERILSAPIDPTDVEIKPDADGTVYLPSSKFQKILNSAFGRGAWALMPLDNWKNIGQNLQREWGLYVLDRYITQAIGEQEFNPNNPTDSWATASEGCWSNGLMRCCKHLGIAAEMWDKGWIQRFKEEHCTHAWVESLSKRDLGKKKKAWRRNDRKFSYPFKELPAPKMPPMSRAQQDLVDEMENHVNQGEVDHEAPEQEPEETPPPRKEPPKREIVTPALPRQKPVTEKPKEPIKVEPPPEDAKIETGQIQRIVEKSGINPADHKTQPNQKWTRWGIQVNNKWHNTFSTTHARIATEANRDKGNVKIVYLEEPGDKGPIRIIHSVSVTYSMKA